MKNNSMLTGKRLVRSFVFSLSLAGTIPLFPQLANASYIYGGPLWDATTESGHLVGPTSGTSVQTGFAAGQVTKFENGEDKGRRAVRWDASGTAAIEMGNLGTSNAGVTVTTVTSVNEDRIAVGYANKYESGNGKGIRAVRWDVSGTIATELGNLGTSNIGVTEAQAEAINVVGTTVGYAEKYEAGSSKGDRAVRWDASSTVATELGHLGLSNGGNTFSQAYDINASGTAVGFAQKYGPNFGFGERAVRWDASGTTATEFANLGDNGVGVTDSEAYAINDLGTAVGYSRKYQFGDNIGTRAVRWAASGTAVTQLGTIGTDGSSYTNASAHDINNAGTAVGYATRYLSGESRGDRPVRWNASGTTATQLEILNTDEDGDAVGYAIEINEAGITVGYLEEYDPINGDWIANRAVAWELDGSVFVLNAILGSQDANWVNLSKASGISDTFWISGIGLFDPDDEGPLQPYERLFLLDVISHFGIPGDANRDGHVDFNDLLIVAQNYGSTSGAVWDTGDFNDDGGVNFNDLLTLSQNYGEPNFNLNSNFDSDWTHAQSLVPEPSSLCVLVVGFIALRRKH